MNIDYEIIDIAEVPSFIELTFDYFRTIDYNLIYTEFIEVIKEVPDIMNSLQHYQQYSH